MNTPSTFEFTTQSSDAEVAMIDVAWQALSRLDRYERSRAAQYLSARAEADVYAITHEDRGADQ